MHKKNSLSCFLSLLLPVLAFAQKATVSGYLEDAATGEPLIAANVYEPALGAGAVSNTYGFYSLTAEADSLTLVFSYIGYQPETRRIALGGKNVTLNVKLQQFVELATVEVTADRVERIEERTQMSRMEVPVEQIKRLPAIFGEVDVIKSLQLLPGVQAGPEGQTGLYVRGGSPDQNLVLLDGVPVYNVSHLLGIFSVFNADAVKNVTLTKGGFPARYGGRLSSVIEINMKEGNTQELHGEGAVGLISSKLTLEGPIAKGKTSFLVSGRRTYIDLLTAPFIRAAQENSENSFKLKLYFYDLNAKIQHKFNDRHRLFLSAYSGSDVFGATFTEPDAAISTGINWGNLIGAVRWNWQINPRLFANTTLTYSQYEIEFLVDQESKFNNQRDRFSARYLSGIEDIGGKIDFDFIPNPRHYVRFGAGVTNHTYSPGALALKAEAGADTGVQLDTLLGSDLAYSTEYFTYIEDDWSLGALKINAGLHASAFNVEGELYTSLQPRLGLRYLLDNDLALKASFSTMTQFINLLTSEALSLPTDLWVPSTRRVLPQTSWQAALGAARTLWDEYEFSLEAYYKQMHNVISFKEGASFLFGLENDWQEKVTQGEGEAYGLEVFLQKKQGKATGWIGYTLSWNWRQFDDINSGQRYPFRYDRRHDVSVVFNYDFTPRIGISTAWVYGTGNAITLNTFRYPSEVYSFDGNQFFINDIETGGQRNAFRMRNYHRLDFSIEFRKQKPRWERKWVISTYNTYMRKNPYFITSSTRTQNGQTQRVFREFSILPFILPSISYQFKF